MYFFSVTGMLGQIYYCTIITAILAHFANSASIDVKGELISKYFFISVYIFFCKFLLNCSQKWHFVSKIVLTYCEKKLFWLPRKTIYLNREMSEQFLKENTFLNLFLEVFWRSDKLAQLEQIIGIKILQEQVIKETIFSLRNIHLNIVFIYFPKVT